MCGRCKSFKLPSKPKPSSIEPIKTKQTSTGAIGPNNI